VSQEARGPLKQLNRCPRGNEGTPAEGNGTEGLLPTSPPAESNHE